MATTLKQGFDQLVTDNDILGDNRFPSALLIRYLNLAQKYVQKVLNGLGIKKWEQGYDATGDLATTTYNGASLKKVTLAQIKTGSSYDVSIQSNSIRLIECGDGASLALSTNFGIAREAEEDTFHKIIEDSYLAPTITEPRFMWQDNEIILSPSTITACKIHFYRVVKDLSSNSDEFEVPDEFIDHVLKRASIDIKNRKGLLNDKDEAIAQLDKEIKDQFSSFMITSQETEKKDEVQLG